MVVSFFNVTMHMGIGFSIVPNLLTRDTSYPRLFNSAVISSVGISQGMPRITTLRERSSGRVLVWNEIFLVVKNF